LKERSKTERSVEFTKYVTHPRTIVAAANDCLREISIRYYTVDITIATIAANFGIIEVYRESASGSVIDSVDDSSLYPGGKASTSRAEQAGAFVSHARRGKVWSEPSIIKVIRIKIKCVAAHIINFAYYGTTSRAEPPKVVNNFIDVVQSGLELADGV
jgi:hypothetical protein